ncbi:DUF2330 domain-containing protein [Spirulina major]|uniref:DUF2330 domain-containing protein n=1 Tax=Spirulina major TaxID=270636 RepID=UPI000A04A1CE|nr:DUF2330 domain-containing protein [Spirulina major]
MKQQRHWWRSPLTGIPQQSRSAIALVIGLLSLLIAPPALAFCGFYVSQANASLYNQASQVIIARNGDRTVLTMANDYQGDVRNFALVVPLPTLIRQDQVQVSNPEIITRLDQFSAPRLVEYFDENPCDLPVRGATRGGNTAQFDDADYATLAAGSHGVTVEAQFSVGEYDIVLLSAQESSGLETWLRQNNYNIPAGAAQVLTPYIRQNFKFFVARVNLTEFRANQRQRLRPLMMAYESPRFMLPIRLGMLNAQGPQDLLIYILTPTGQVELTNYRTVQIPSDFNVPDFVQDEFGRFYNALFQTSYEQANREVGFLEYAWDMSWCDPCAAEPLTATELQQAGAFWVNAQASGPTNPVFMTRLHVRYERDRFPEDLSFQTTGNTQNFQGRYIIQHPYRGSLDCPAAEGYYREVSDRQQLEAETLAHYTGWSEADVNAKMNWLLPPSAESDSLRP